MVSGPCGFAALQLNVQQLYLYDRDHNPAGHRGFRIINVPVHKWGSQTLEAVKSIPAYVRRNMLTILRFFVVYKPLRFFVLASLLPFFVSFGLFSRFILYYLFDPVLERSSH